MVSGMCKLNVGDLRFTMSPQCNHSSCSSVSLTFSFLRSTFKYLRTFVWVSMQLVRVFRRSRQVVVEVRWCRMVGKSY